jgi:hypothetical protein
LQHPADLFPSGRPACTRLILTSTSKLILTMPATFGRVIDGIELALLPAPDARLLYS